MPYIRILTAASIMLSSVINADPLYETGRALFTEGAVPSCTICHTLKEAGASGEVGPNLNELKPSLEQVINVVTGGSGVMPAFDETLSAQEIKAIAHYVSTASRLE
ncbi:cytochrome c [Neptuniibacter sp. CAU 1671]|uniref:SorU family sulfite dehydrogenase c-type cytochrome subunit n=1 Tax=Neptuniibacter sp. CAU 1671 TaxID=3032593 RepID=UPI0023DCC4A6|nr:cytochrome c [Neptuniibacter sp. CAU 1671]MDF2182661.1 cytochrome c [Neptuniibacter sp. CAU 1671]